MKRFVLALSMLTIVLGLFTLGLHGAHAASQHAETFHTAVDWKSYQRIGPMAHVWFLRSFRETAELGHATYPHRSQRVQYAIDCDQRTYALSQWILTDGENGAGQVVWADRAASLEFIKPFAGTLEAAVIHAACEVKPGARIATHVH